MEFKFFQFLFLILIITFHLFINIFSTKFSHYFLTMDKAVRMNIDILQINKMH